MFALAGCGQEATAPAPAEPAGSAAPMSAEQPHPMPAAEVADVDLSGIEKPEGGMTIAELYAGKAELAGQAVTVRGKVVKVNPNIMGRNWIHVRDGSGAEGTNNLAVTTNQLPNVGDTVLLTGALEADKDFGMGYTYELIIEQPELTIEGYGDE